MAGPARLALSLHSTACPRCLCRRLHERQASRVSITVHDSPAATATSVSASNLLLGHGLVLRGVALAQALAQDAEAAQRHQAATAAAAVAEGEPGGLSRSASMVGLPSAEPSQQSVAAEESHGPSGPEPAGQPPALACGNAPRAEGKQAAAGTAAEPSSAALDVRQPPAMPEEETEHQRQHEACEETQLATAVQPACPQQATGQAADRARGTEQPPHTPAKQAPPALAAPAAAPAKQVLTSVHLIDCRVVLRYQPVLHPAGGGRGEGSLHGLGSSGIPATAHDFLSVHHDLLALDVPLLRLQLPLDPASMADAAVAAGRVAPAAAMGPGSRGWGSRGDSTGTSAGSSPLSGDSPRTAGSSRAHGRSWRELSVAASAQAAVPPMGEAWQADGRALQPQHHTVIEASRLMLSVAALGYAQHPMLPLLQLPSLQLRCSVSAASAAAAPQQPGQTSPAAAAAPEVHYQLEVCALDVGLHPSQLSMLTTAAQLCEFELLLLGRELHEASSADSESAVTSFSGTTLEHQEPMARQQQRQQQQHAAPAPGATPAAAGSSPAGAGGSLDTAYAGGPSPASAVAQQGAAPAVDSIAQVAAPHWRLDAALGYIGLSLLGSTPSSSCLKAEWRGLRAVYAAGSSSDAGLHGSPGPSLQRLGSSRSGSSKAARAAAAGAAGEQHEVELSWHQLAVHVLEPRTQHSHPSLSPFAFASGLVAEAQRGRCTVGGRGGASKLGVPGSPRLASADLSLPGRCRGSLLEEGGPGLSSSRDGASPRFLAGPGSIGGAGEVFYQRARGPLSASGAPGVRRNLSAGLNIAGARAGTIRGMWQNSGLDASRAHLPLPHRPMPPPCLQRRWPVRSFMRHRPCWAAPPTAPPAPATSPWQSLSLRMRHPSWRQVGGGVGGAGRAGSAVRIRSASSAPLPCPPAGAQSPPASAGPPLPPPLPLQVGSSMGYTSALLAMLYASPAADEADIGSSAAGSPVSDGRGPARSQPAGIRADVRSPSLAGSVTPAGSAGRTLVSAQVLPEEHRAVVAVDAVSLRLHAAGWDGALKCLHTYAVLAQQAQRQYSAAAAARAASPATARRLPVVAAAAALHSVEPPARGVAVRLHLRSLLLELLADAQQQPLHGSAGSSSWGSSAESLVPACTVQAELQLDMALAPDAGSHVDVLVPGLLLSFGTVPVASAALSSPAPLAIPPSDALLGLHRLELSLVSQQQHVQAQPAATTSEGSVLVGAVHQVSVGASLAHASVWAHPRNLCGAAALAGHARELAVRLADVLPQADYEPAAPAERVRCHVDGGLAPAARRQRTA